MYKIGVIGEKECVIGFSALGLDVYTVENEAEAVDVFTKISGKDTYAIIYVTETWQACLAEKIEKFSDSPSPAIIIIPGASGAAGSGQKAIDRAVERAVGAVIF